MKNFSDDENIKKRGISLASNELIRIQKIIADAGIASRRKAEELIQKGLVKVNGKTVTLGDKANPKKDEIIGKRAAKQD